MKQVIVNKSRIDYFKDLQLIFKSKFETSLKKVYPKISIQNIFGFDELDMAMLYNEISQKYGIDIQKFTKLDMTICELISFIDTNRKNNFTKVIKLKEKFNIRKIFQFAR